MDTVSVSLGITQWFKYSREINHLEAQFKYPKMVIVENNRTIRILDIGRPKQFQEVCVHEVDSEIVNKIIKDDYFWTILKSGETFLIKLEDGSCRKLYFDNYSGSKPQHLKCNDKDVVLINETGECFLIQFTNNGINKDPDELNEECAVNLRRIMMMSPSSLKSCTLNYFFNGFEMYLENGLVMLNCPISGLNKTITSVMKFDHVLPWDEFIVLVKESAMYIVDMKDSAISFEFEKINGNYYPIAVYNNMFYYIVWSNSQICIYSASNSSVERFNNSEAKNCLNSSTTKLSSEEHLKLQLKMLIEEATAPECKLNEVMAPIQTLFEKITDYSFLINCALKLCQHNIAYKLIMYSLQTRLYAIGDKDMINLVIDLIIKVDLLEYINFRGNNYYNDINLFDKNFKQLCTIFVTHSDLDLAAICWLKYSEIKILINQDDIIEILNSIPHNIKLGALIIWLKKFIPSLLDENPFFIDLFVKWTMTRVFELEKSGYWPKIGLKFIDEIIKVLESSLKTVTIRPISMDDLDTLKDHINYIMELKEKYKINMLLAELSSQSPNEVALIKLRRCYTEDLELFLHDYLPSYAARHLFDLDDTLRSFIENDAAFSGGNVDGCRLKLLLDSLRSTTIKLDCLLQVLKVLDVPWSPAVLDLAINAAASATKDFTVSDADRALALEIQNEINYANVKVVLKKYNFHLSCTDYMLVLHKIVNASSVDINDLQVITSGMTNFNNYGNVIYIVRCLQDCESNRALDYFNNLSNIEKKKMLKVITTKYEQMVNNDESNIIIERNYLDFLKGTKLLNEIEINNIESLYHLKNSYNIAMNLNDLYNEDCCLKRTNSCIANEAYIASSGRGGCVTKLMQTDLSRNSKLMSLLRRTSTNQPVRKIIESLVTCFSLEGSSSSDIIESALSVFKDGGNSTLLLDSTSVLVTLVIGCAEEHLHYLINNLSALNALQNANLIPKNLSVAWKFHYIFLPMSSLTAINDLINFYVNAIQNGDSMPTFYSERCDFIPFSIISSFLGIAMNLNYLHNEDFFKKRNNIAKKLLHKVIGSQDLDEVLLTALLLILNRHESHENSSWILELLQGQNESLSPAIMCYLTSPIMRRTFGLDTNLSGNEVSYPPQYILKSKFNMNLPEIALTDCSEETWDVKVILFYVLRQNPEMTFEKLIDSCRTLNVSLNDGLSLQLIALLTTWELKYKIINDNLTSRQINFENDHKEITAKCLVIWENINNKDFIKDILCDLWKNGEVTLHGRLVAINPYYYEVYLCIYRLVFGSSIELRNKKEYFLLNFLMNYRRNSAPKQYEYELFSVKGMFPEIGHYRLPFQLFMREDMWSNLKSEITLETYERWLPVVALLALDPDLQTSRDMICSNALKQTMTNRKRSDNGELDSKENEPWKLISREEPLLRAAHRCVRHIANMEWAGACLFYVLQGCARGADQVAAAQLCYQFAHRWAELQPGNRAVRQMKRLHLTLSTRHALHKIDWACEEFVRLLTEPAQLIRALYLHPNFVEKMSRHDVNRAANEIAEKNGINISTIRIQILENILDKLQDENKSMSFLGLDTKELMTAKYILKATCPKMGAIYLSRIAFDDESDFNKCKKLRALQCLMSVVDPDTAVKVTNKERGELWISLLELLYVVNLEHIDMPWIVATFVQNKISALEQLLQSATTNIDALKVGAELARRFGNTKIILNLIPVMLRTGLYEEMIPLLLKVSSPPNDITRAAWRAIILSPFQRADYPITEKQRIKCLNAVNLLPVCPVIKDEDLKEIWKHCVRCKCFGIGCLILPYMTSDARQSLVELKKIDRRNLIASLKNLHTETYLVSGAMFVLENMSIKNYRSK